MLFRPLLFLGIFLATSPSLHAQQFTVKADDGLIITLPDGRFAVLRKEGGTVLVSGVVKGENSRGAFLDIAPGDRVIAFQSDASPSIERITTAWAALPAGAEVLLTLARGNAAPHQVRFARPTPQAGDSARMITVNDRPDAGAWVSAGSPSNVAEMSIAGAKIRNNKEGLPEVVSRGSHPAASAVPLRPGDVITAVNGRTIAALAGLERFYQPLKSGDEVTLTVTRDGQPKAITFRKPSE